MKKIIFLLALLASFSTHAIDMNWVQSLGSKEIKPVFYTLDTTGKALRVYEWCALGSNTWHMIVASSTKGMELKNSGVARNPKQVHP